MSNAPVTFTGDSYPPIDFVNDLDNVFERIRKVNEEDGCCALFDAGALFKDISNDEVARIIKLGGEETPNFDAVLFYHQEKNLLFYIDASDSKVPKRAPKENHFSTLKDELQKDRIFLYLDQAHTVGTDINLNDNNASCITTVSELVSVKDLLQALLRARQLLGGIDYTETEEIVFNIGSTGKFVDRQRMRFLWMPKISDKKIDDDICGTDENLKKLMSLYSKLIASSITVVI